MTARAERSAPTAPGVAHAVFRSPIGELLLVASRSALLRLHVTEGRYVPAMRPEWRHDPAHPVLAQACAELAEYFAGSRRTFDVPLDPQGTPFQRRVWAALTGIPYGATRSYAQQALAIGQPEAVRAVGAANGRNPISILVPCHRVLASDGSLAGYAGGLSAKRWLLDREAGRSPSALGDLSSSG